MAKEPRTPKSNAGAPAQFDMNSRERKGGKGGPGRRGRDDNRPPSRIENLPPSLVDRGVGWTIWKVGKIDQASHAPAGAEYQLIFDGHEPLVFGFLGAARDRSKEAPPEKAAVGEGEASASDQAAGGNTVAEDVPTEHSQPD